MVKQVHSGSSLKPFMLSPEHRVPVFENRPMVTLIFWLLADGLTYDDFLKIWKGLHYCMWMSDKPLVQVSHLNRVPVLILIILGDSPTYDTLSLLSTAANALPATSGARGTECYRRSVGIVSLVVGLPFSVCLREYLMKQLKCNGIDRIAGRIIQVVTLEIYWPSAKSRGPPLGHNYLR